MKKSLIYTLAALAFIISTGATAVISSFATTEPVTESQTLDSRTDLGASSTKTSLTRSENVFVITNPDGSENKSFIGNTINNSTRDLPVKMHIDYFLDGRSISTDELRGKSGHVKITFTFNSIETYQDKIVPFLTVTGLDLDSSKFKNVKIDHGKIISESGDNIILAGYTFAGIKEDLGTDLLSSSFTITADVTDFELKDTYTFATNEIFAELDTTKLSTVDGLINSVNDLGTTFDRIIAGSTELVHGTNDLATGAAQLSAGANNLAQGVDQLATGANQLTTGMHQLVDFNSSIVDKIDSTEAEVTSIIKTIIEEYEIDPNSELISKLNSQLRTYYTTAHTAITTYTGNIKQLSDGADQLKSGLDQLSTGLDQLAAGANELSNGANKLNQGAHTLNTGLSTFKTQGIDRLVNFAQNDLRSFTNNLRSTVTAADSYHYYSNSQAESVKFIFKTPSI